MNEIIKINNHGIIAKEYKGQRVVTFKDIDTVHERTDGTAGRNFRENRNRFIENEDYFILNQPDEIRLFGFERPQGGTPKELILITEQGYLMLVKSLTDDLAWEVQRKLVNGYFRHKKEKTAMEGLAVVKFIADDLRVSDSSRLFMYENYCKDVGIPTGFIPKYTNNGNKEQCSATELLQRNGCGIKASKFNQLMIAAGYMELRERKSSKGETKQYKALTDKGQKYGVNLISNQNQKECQPYYFADSFMELYHKVAG